MQLYVIIDWINFGLRLIYNCIEVHFELQFFDFDVIEFELGSDVCPNFHWTW